MKDYTQRRLEKFEKKFVIPMYEDESLGGNYEAVKAFLSTSITQAIAEDRERVRGEIENECNSELVYAGKNLADSGGMGLLNAVILRLKENLLSSLNKPVIDKQ